MPDYSEIFCGHVNRILDERGMTRQELAGKSGISSAMLSDIKRGVANPTLKSMEAIATSLNLPLPLLLKPSESDEWQAIFAITASHVPLDPTPYIPQGYGFIEQVVLPRSKIEIIKDWLAVPRRGRPRKNDSLEDSNG